MSKFFYLGKKSRPKPCHKIKMKINIKVLNIIVVGLVAFSGVAYLIQMNSLATKGYKIRELETKIEGLNQESKNLELQVLELQSMDNIKNKVSQLNMVAIGKIDYLMPTPVALANK